MALDHPGQQNATMSFTQIEKCVKTSGNSELRTQSVVKVVIVLRRVGGLCKELTLELKNCFGTADEEAIYMVIRLQD